MGVKSVIAAACVGAVVANVSVCGVAHADDCYIDLGGDVSLCPSSGMVKNLSSDWVIGLTPMGFSPAPATFSPGSTLAAQLMSGMSHGRTLMLPPGATALTEGQIWVEYDTWGTVALQAGMALCNATKLCSLLLNSFNHFDGCVEGAADALGDANDGVMPDYNQIVGYVQTGKACRSAVEDMKRLQELAEKKPVPEGKRQVAVDALMEEIPKEADLKPIKVPKFSILEFGKVLLKGRG